MGKREGGCRDASFSSKADGRGRVDQDHSKRPSKSPACVCVCMCMCVFRPFRSWPPKTASRAPQECCNEFMSIFSRISMAHCNLGGHCGGPRAPHEASRSLHEAPGSPQERPRSPQETPRSPQEHPEWASRPPKIAQDTPKPATHHHTTLHKHDNQLDRSLHCRPILL